jgi:hypothetical protein
MLKRLKKLKRMLLETNLIQSILQDLDLINTITIVIIIRTTVIKINETDTVNLSLSLMQLLKVKVY